MLERARLAQAFQQDAAVELVEAIRIKLIAGRLAVQAVAGLHREANALQGMEGMDCRLRVAGRLEALCRRPAQTRCGAGFGNPGAECLNAGGIDKNT